MAEFGADVSGPAMVRIGRIVGIHGVRGALRFKPDNPDSDTIDEIESVVLELNGARREYEVVSSARAGRGAVKVELEGVAGADAAEALKGAVVMVPAESLPEVSEGEVYYFQLVGCEAHTTDGQFLGRVTEVFSNGANDVMVVREGSHETLIPVIEDVVKSIDLDARRVTIEPVPGLLG